MKITIITHYYPPEIGAPQARLSEMAATWISLGHHVTVITCFPNHPTGKIPSNYQNKSYQEETINHVKVCRCQTYATPNTGFIKKLIGHLLFMINAVRQAGKEVKETDIILVSSPTFFSVMSAYWLSKKYKKPFIFEVRDLWPAIFKELGVIKNKWLLACLERWELFLYKKATKVVTVTHSFTENIINRGIPKSKVHTITNGVNLDLFSPTKPDSELLNRLKLTHKFVVLYMGAHGISQGLDTIVDVAKQLQTTPDIHFLFVGEGAQKDALQNNATQYQLNNITFLPNQPKDHAPLFYGIANTVLVPLRNIPLFNTFIPSKIFEIMAMAKPIIASLEGESKTILQTAHCALIAPPENSDAIAQHILTLYNCPNTQKELGNNGYHYVRQHYDRKVLAKRYEEILLDCFPNPEKSSTTLLGNANNGRNKRWATKKTTISAASAAS